MFPEDLPVRDKYKYIREHWDDKHVYSSFGTVQIEICDMNEQRCPFPNQCNVCAMFEKEVQEGLKEQGDIDMDEFNFQDLLPDTDEINRLEIDNLKNIFNSQTEKNCI